MSALDEEIKDLRGSEIPHTSRGDAKAKRPVLGYALVAVLVAVVLCVLLGVGYGLLSFVQQQPAAEQPAAEQPAANPPAANPPAANPPAANPPAANPPAANPPAANPPAANPPAAEQPAQQPAQQPVPEYIEHTVVAGNTLYGLADYYKVSIADILRLNPIITDPTMLTIGWVLRIPNMPHVEDRTQTGGQDELPITGWTTPGAVQIITNTYANETILIALSSDVASSIELRNPGIAPIVYRPAYGWVGVFEVQPGGSIRISGVSWNKENGHQNTSGERFRIPAGESFEAFGRQLLAQWQSREKKPQWLLFLVSSPTPIVNP